MSDKCEQRHPIEAQVDNCRSCGAPQCCKWCCEVQSLNDQISNVQAENKLLHESIAAGGEVSKRGVKRIVELEEYNLNYAMHEQKMQARHNKLLATLEAIINTRNIEMPTPDRYLKSLDIACAALLPQSEGEI